ncbi:ALF repeat-containing protein [Actinopolyspora xinjiangensis]|uniref:ALF repeat-containing protein n=1 Tax=Actinopolyspora xinjiangensis TaxID=405564 RepID=UPI001113BF69|nr:ALF repeat-containing protein [Actinopolyspora xinjiangensis]
MDAAKQAQNVVQIARDAEAERIRADKQQAIAEAKEDADSHQEERSRAEWEEVERNRVSEETRKLLNAAEAPDADPATVVSKGRQAAVNLLSTGGPWTKRAAQQAQDSAERAQNAARTAREAASRAREDARSAKASASIAEASAASARTSAAAAYESAASARESALSAGEDAKAASSAAREALRIMLDKHSEVVDESHKNSESPPRFPEKVYRYSHGTTQVYFEGHRYINGAKPTKDLDQPCEMPEKSVDQWIGDNYRNIQSDDIVETGHAPSILLRMYCLKNRQARGNDLVGKINNAYLPEGLFYLETKRMSVARPLIRIGLAIWRSSVQQRSRMGDLPTNRALHEAYVKSRYAGMEKPRVNNPKIQDLMDESYRNGSKFGNESTAAAARIERALHNIGAPVGGRHHDEKAQNMIRSLQKWLKNNPRAANSDRDAAKQVISDLRNALEGM